MELAAYIDAAASRQLAGGQELMAAHNGIDRGFPALG
jgi:hypothetical protein